jgi:HSP20 family protein
MAEKAELRRKNRTEQTGPEQTRSGPHFTPRVDIWETDKELVLEADVPGVAPQDVDLHYERGELVLHGRVNRRQHAGPQLLGEYEDGDFHRVFQVHESIAADHIQAECKNGVLTIHLPKEEAAQPRKVAVKGG